MESTNDDQAVTEVVAALRERISGTEEAYFGSLIRRSIDEVLDGSRTGRYDFFDLEKTEKTYVGTKIEIMLRSDLDLEKGKEMDLTVAGHEVDVKWAMNSSWQIPQEAYGHVCLCIGGKRRLSTFQAGVVRCSLDRLNTGRNRDGKGTLSGDGRAAIDFLVEDSNTPRNFVETLDPEIRDAAFSEPTIQGRVTKLFQQIPYVAVPRSAIQTIAKTTGDPIRRLRADKQAGDPLEGLVVLSAKYANPIVNALDLPPLKADEFMAVRTSDLESLQAWQWSEMSDSVRKRFSEYVARASHSL